MTLSLAKNDRSGEFLRQVCAGPHQMRLVWWRNSSLATTRWSVPWLTLRTRWSSPSAFSSSSSLAWWGPRLHRRTQSLCFQPSQVFWLMFTGWGQPDRQQQRATETGWIHFFGLSTWTYERNSKVSLHDWLLFHNLFFFSWLWFVICIFPLHICACAC